MPLVWNVGRFNDITLWLKDAKYLDEGYCGADIRGAREDSISKLLFHKI